MHTTNTAKLLLLTVLSCTCLSRAQVAPTFRIQDRGTVVFYGDSITEQRLYTADIENFVLTRFPDRHVRFINSGVGGDKVSGGWAGPIDLRLARDLFAYRPTVVTIMLGMNDGYYRPFDPGIATTFEDGYRHIISEIQLKMPQASLTLIQPSPYDDVTRAPTFEQGYNTIMIRFGDFIGKLAAEKHTLLADLNHPVVDALTKAKDADSAISTTLVRDRIHPGPGAHWLMAEALLKAWNAPAIVTSVKMDGPHAKVTEVVSTEIQQLQRRKNGLSWVQNDHALPLPLPPDAVDPFLALVLRVSDLNQALNQEILQIAGLADGTYDLQIDEHSIGSFTAAQLSTGVNLATLDTPMLSQSRLLAMDTEKRNEIEAMRFTLANDTGDPKEDPHAGETVKKLEAAIEQAVDRQHKDAQPVSHKYSLVRTTPVHSTGDATKK